MATYIDEINGGWTDQEGYHRPLSRLYTGGVPSSYSGSAMLLAQRAAGANMSVDVSVGDIHFETPTKTHSYWGWIDAAENVPISAADPTNGRVDTIVAYVDINAVNAAANNSPGTLKFYVGVGTPSADPSATAMTMSAIQTALGADIPIEKLGTVLVGAGATSITTGMITDTRRAINALTTVGANSVKTGSISDNAVTTAKLAGNSVTADKIDFNNLPYGRIYFSTSGSGGGQVIGATTTATLAFNTIDPDAKLITSPAVGELQVDRAGTYKIAATTCISDAPQNNQLLHFQISTDNGTTWIDATIWNMPVNAGTVGRGINDVTTINLPANAKVRVRYHNGGTGATRVAALSEASRKYQCSLTVSL